MNTAENSKKLEEISAKMDDLLQKDCELLYKLNEVEKTQATISQAVEALKESFKLMDREIKEVTSNMSQKADCSDLEALNNKIDDLENCSKCNIIIWGVVEESEEDFPLMEDFVANGLLRKHMKLEREIEVMRAHRTRINQDLIN